MLIAMSPFVESRGAIPVGLALGIPPHIAFLLSFVGNLIPVVPLLLFLEPVTSWLRRFSLMDRLMDRLFAWTRKRHSAKKVGLAGLIATAIIPAPLTGAWTGVLIAFLFDIRFRVAFPTIVVGVLQEAVVVMLISLGVIHILGL